MPANAKKVREYEELKLWKLGVLRSAATRLFPHPNRLSEIRLTGGWQVTKDTREASDLFGYTVTEEAEIPSGATLIRKDMTRPTAANGVTSTPTATRVGTIGEFALYSRPQSIWRPFFFGSQFFAQTKIGSRVRRDFRRDSTTDPWEQYSDSGQGDINFRFSLSMSDSGGIDGGRAVDSDMTATRIRLRNTGSPASLSLDVFRQPWDQWAPISSADIIAAITAELADDETLDSCDLQVEFIYD